jgi:Ca2+-dependent lipid-binding protein
MDAAVDRLEVKVVEARDLRNVESGSPSPYAEVMVGYNSYATKNLVETNNPIWVAPAMSFASLLANGIDAIIIYVKHKDIFTGKDTILGYASIPMNTYYGAPKVEIDAWYDLLNAGQSREQNEPLGKIRTRITYFNELDEDLVEVGAQQGKIKPPNMLEVVVLDGKEFQGGKNVEPFVIIQVGDLRKETRSAKKSKTPTWNDKIMIPVMNGDEVIDITVKNTTIIVAVFLGRIRIPLNEVAAAGEAGIRKVYTLLNENLVFEGAGNGFLQLQLRWYFDQAQDELNNRVLEKRKSMLMRLAAMMPFVGKRLAAPKEEKEEKKVRTGGDKNA